MARPKNSSRPLAPLTGVVSLTATQSALWHLGLPVLDSKTVARHKTHAKRDMLLRAIAWPVVGVALLVAFESLGRHWGRVAMVASAGTALMGLFSWLISVSDLNWLTTDYRTYRGLYSVPPHVAAVADALVGRGVSESRIGVEYLKSDPILFVDDPSTESGTKRYDLIIW